MSNCDLPTIAQARAARLEARVHELAGILNQAHARLVDVVAEAIEHESWGGGGIMSPNHWLVLHAGLSRGRAATVVELARRRADRPATMAAFDAGDLSLEQAAMVARHTPSEYDASVAELALHATVPQIYRAVSRYSFAKPTTTSSEPSSTTTSSSSSTSGSTTDGTDQGVGTEASDQSAAASTPQPSPASAPLPDPTADTDLAADPDPGPQLSMSYDANGRFVLRYTAAADVGALIEAALKEAKDALFAAATQGATGATGVTVPPTTAGSMGFTCSYGQVFTQILTGHLQAATEASASRRDLYRVLVHLDAGGAWLNGRPPLPAHLAEKLTCEGAVSPLWEREGVPVRLGRTRRIVPPRVRALILDRDRGCRYPGCPASVRSHLDIHHIRHWLHGGPTDPENLIAVCPFHHDAHHGGLYTIRGNPDLPDQHPQGLRFTTDRGLPITAAPPTPPTRGPADPADPPGRPPVYHGPTGETLHLKWVDFQPAS